jgi:hypothetical protein
MAKVLVIRKTDKTVHVVPMTNKATLMSYNNRLPETEKWKFEEMDEDEAAKLPFIDESYVTAAEAQDKVQELATVVSEKDAKILELEAQLAALNAGAVNAAETAVSKIAKINAAETAEEVATILGDDVRVTVVEAATKKTASFQQA